MKVAAVYGHGFLNTRWVISAGLLLIGALMVAFPGQFVTRTAFLSDAPAANIWLIYAVGVALSSISLALIAEAPQQDAPPAPGMLLGVTLLALLYFLLLCFHLRDWWIDDAGITFAYSRSLAEGSGIVAQPWMSPEEGYSSSVWMLLLSGMGRLGFDIPLTAKYLGTGFTSLCLLLSAWVLARENAGPLAILLCGVGLACGPTVVWAVSGQEHALQSLLLLGVVLCVYTMTRWRLPVALLLSLFVLTRPEAPVIVIGVFLAALVLTVREKGWRLNTADIAIALLPFLAFVALMWFRSSYFGDLFPNPFYAKTSGSSFVGLINPLSGGWYYTFAGLRDTALFLVVGLAFLIHIRPLPAWIVVAVAILLSQLFFILWAKGDWMAHYRFLMPVLPILLLLCALGLKGITSRRARMLFSGVAIVVLSHSTAMEQASFRSAPVTPLAEVTAVGNTFAALAEKMEIDDPLLAHHDAGGISYHRMVRLLDLGGLVSRAIGQNMEDRAFLLDYIVNEMRPDFVFGRRNFAAASGFADDAAFADLYLRLEFAGLPYMESDLSYIRRDLAMPGPGIELIEDAEGRPIRLRVEVPDQQAE